MGLFDIFTGGTMKRAAKANMKRADTVNTENQGYLDSSLASGTDYLNKAISGYQPLYDAGNKSLAGYDMYANALGLNGQSGTDAAKSAFQAGPGYQWNVDQALDQTNRRANASGMQMSGNTLAALQDRASNLADQSYQGWLGNLGSYNQQGQAMLAQGATGQAQGYGNLATLGNTTAAQKVASNNNYLSAANGANTQYGQAGMAGAANALNFGLNLGNLYTKL